MLNYIRYLYTFVLIRHPKIGEKISDPLLQLGTKH
jgi:hypothetical protein